MDKMVELMCNYVANYKVCAGNCNWAKDGSVGVESVLWITCPPQLKEDKVAKLEQG